MNHNDFPWADGSTTDNGVFTVVPETVPTKSYRLTPDEQFCRDACLETKKFDGPDAAKEELFHHMMEGKVGAAFGKRVLNLINS